MASELSFHSTNFSLLKVEKNFFHCQLNSSTHLSHKIQCHWLEHLLLTTVGKAMYVHLCWTSFLNEVHLCWTSFLNRENREECYIGKCNELHCNHFPLLFSALNFTEMRFFDKEKLTKRQTSKTKVKMYFNNLHFDRCDINFDREHLLLLLHLLYLNQLSVPHPIFKTIPFLAFCSLCQS